MNNKLVGKWRIHPEDHVSIQTYGNTEIEFTAAGELIYTIYEDGRAQKIFLTYEIAGNEILTNQPSSPEVEKSGFELLSDKELQIMFGGINSRYIKIDE